MVDYEEETDESLVARLQRRDHRAFATLVRRHTNRFYVCAWRMCSYETLAEDVVQDAFLKLWSKPEAFDPGRGVKFTTWFTRVVMNLAIDALRKKRPEVPGDAFDKMADSARNAEEALMDKQRHDALEAAIQLLPIRQKAALNLCFYEGFSNKEAAEVLGVKVKALESLLMRAKKALKETLSLDPKTLEVKKYG